VKWKNPPGPISALLDFQLNLAELNGLVAQRTELTGSVTAPHPGPRMRWQLSLFDTSTGNEPQFSLHWGQQFHDHPSHDLSTRKRIGCSVIRLSVTISSIGAAAHKRCASSTRGIHVAPS
jgi:hypothetical protein